ncbi:MAG TPA: TolC family protein [Candidatus Acidoferrum sp.]|nr:TolC family protein [Candidatus Acidoferrum sp.]
MNNWTRPWFAVAALGAALLTPRAACAQDAKPLTLREAVTLALQNSRDLALAKVQYSIAQGEVAVDKGAFHPNLYTGAGAAYTSGFPATPGGNGPSVFSLSYTQSVFNLPLSGQVKAAEDRASNAKLEVDRVRDDVIVRTASEYLDLANVRHALELLRSEQASAEKILQVTQDRANAGQELPIEVTRSQLTAAQVQERILKLEGREENLTEELRSLTGIPEEREIVTDSEEPSFSTDQQEADLMAMALKSSADIQEAENERSAREHIFKGAKGAYWPSVSIIGQYEVLAKYNNYQEFYNHFQRNNVTLGFTVQIPLFSSQTRANVALARSQLNEAQLLVGSKRDAVRQDVQQKLRNVRELDASREVARLELKLAQQTLDIVEAKFADGRATLRDIEQARLDENDKWVAFLDANLARQEGQLSLLEATGQLAKVFQ